MNGRYPSSEIGWGPPRVSAGPHRALPPPEASPRSLAAAELTPTGGPRWAERAAGPSHPGGCYRAAIRGDTSLAGVFTRAVCPAGPRGREHTSPHPTASPLRALRSPQARVLRSPWTKTRPLCVDGLGRGTGLRCGAAKLGAFLLQIKASFRNRIIILNWQKIGARFLHLLGLP